MQPAKRSPMHPTVGMLLLMSRAIDPIIPLYKSYYWTTVLNITPIYSLFYKIVSFRRYMAGKNLFGYILEGCCSIH